MNFSRSRKRLTSWLTAFAAVVPLLALSTAHAQEGAQTSPPAKGEVTDVVRDKDMATITIRVPSSLIVPPVQNDVDALSESSPVVPLGVVAVPYGTDKEDNLQAIQVISAVRQSGKDTDKFWLDVKCFRLSSKGDKLELFDGFTVDENETEKFLTSIEPRSPEAAVAINDPNIAPQIERNITRGKYTYHYTYNTLHRYHSYASRARSWYPRARAWSSYQRTAAAERSNSDRNYELNTGGSVHVKGYTRKDGTYVRPHTRSAPGSGRRGH